MAIEGHWVGSYFQDFYADPKRLKDKNPANQFAIEAWFEVDGTTLTGRMVDLNPDRTLPYGEIIERNFFEMNWLEKRRAKAFLAKFPDCEYRMHLPVDSTLVGQISGSKVTFTKTYTGQAEQAYCFGGKAQSYTDDNPPIEYSGELSFDGNTITGTYRLMTMPHNPPDPRAIQTFELHRQL